ncbi:DNA polymerase beta domain protein region [Pseudopedobacter saltans DSM 12145]|uniref:DNA polymerase beta domain protein region n=1 Tax=Pseudopedobacter saltans (strain ATCC 51119 / DSM 12145 / JCM 21818 / CCUG 39354 / LMG 10337 / NBRC 100064 / NCIMB 13643) TaxID=762903 RepID=F0SDF0_PSESL|nr:nucleotidyltransferase family protein [Pseudopedobacter saltans]ADY53933.1 DNA polymerase beta domain protein region [Pseudopedobacter saltans DSM 12145]
MKAKEEILYVLRANKAKLTRLGVKAVGLFGSYLYGEQSKDSDIDLLIDFEPDQENFDNYMAVYDLFETVFKGNKIDVVTKNGLSPYIGQKILNDVLYA